MPCVYKLHILEDEPVPNNEFNIIPSRGTLLPTCSQRIQVDFVSLQERKYEMRLALEALWGHSSDRVSVGVDAGGASLLSELGFRGGGDPARYSRLAPRDRVV